jgi:hypothetical protein
MVEVFTAPKNDTAYFYEGPSRAQATPAVVNSGSNTSAIDGWRQGVELTRQKYYDAGTAKIWSGEPGHALYTGEFGSNDIIRKTTTFADIGKFRTISLVLDSADTVFPILIGDNTSPEGAGSDGAIEPLTIRSVVSFYSTFAPFEPHAMRAAFMGGNEDQTKASDRVLSIDEFRPTCGNIPYLDMVDMFEGRIPMNGFFSSDTTKMSPFVDSRYPLSSSRDSDMLNALSALGGSTDNYVTSIEVSSTNGWTYDNVAGVGADSVAFGGMTY